MSEDRFWVAFPTDLFEEQAPGSDASGHPIVRVTDEFIGPFQDANEVIAAVESLPYGDMAVVAQCDASEGILPFLVLTAAFSAVKAEPATLQIRVLHHFIVTGKEFPTAEDTGYATKTVAEEKKSNTRRSLSRTKK